MIVQVFILKVLKCLHLHLCILLHSDWQIKYQPGDSSLINSNELIFYRDVARAWRSNGFPGVWKGSTKNESQTDENLAIVQAKQEHVATKQIRSPAASDPSKCNTINFS
jgi:hypothetical protein